MDKLQDIQLYLDNKLVISSLKKTVYEDELRKINEKDPIANNEIKINSTYVFKKQDSLEVGFFIRNGSNQRIAFEEICLILTNSKGTNIAEKQENFKGRCSIPSRNAIPLVVEFPLEQVEDYIEGEEYTIKFNSLNNIHAFGSKEVEIKGMNDTTPFEEENEIRDFNNKLPTLIDGEFNIAIYKIIKDGEDKLKISLLFRNAANTKATIEALPILVSDKDGNVVSQAMFSNPEGIVKVESGKAVLQNFMLPCSVKLESESIKDLSVRFE